MCRNSRSLLKGAKTMPKMRYYEYIYVAYGIDKKGNRYHANSPVRNAAKILFQENYPFAIITEIVRYKKDDDQLA